MTAFQGFLRSAPLALLGSAAARVHDLRRVDEVVRTPLPLSRRIGFVQLRGGNGASATAGYVANLLAARRVGPVIGVDAASGARPGFSSTGMLWHAGLPTAAAQRESARRAGAHRAADAVDGLARASSGLWTMSLEPTGGPGAPASVDRWFDQLSPIARFFDVVVTDWGVRDPRIDLADVAAASHVLCIVARADRHAAERAAAVVQAVSALESAPASVLALVDVGATGGAVARIVATSAEAPVVAIPYDRSRAGERQMGSGMLATPTRLAYGRLAEELMTLAVASARPPAAVPRSVAVSESRRARRRHPAASGSPEGAQP